MADTSKVLIFHLEINRNTSKTSDLQNGSRLALAIDGLIAAYWIGKVISTDSVLPMYQIPQNVFI